MKTVNELTATIFVIFGGAGDLTMRKLIPSLFDLFQTNRLPDDFSIIITDKTKLTLEKLRKQLHEGINKYSRLGKVNLNAWNHFSRNIGYIPGNFTDPQTYEALAVFHTKKKEVLSGNIQLIFYLATPPLFFVEIAKRLNEAQLLLNRELSRIVIERPYGWDLESAKKLNLALLSVCHESQLFRIDHHLGKETLQNILVFRFANPLFEPLWDHHFIAYITITVAETPGIDQRGVYYNETGALRDMVQYHAMQLLSLIAMEPVNSLNAEEIRSKMCDVLRAIRPIPPENLTHYVVRGQYAGSKIGGKEVPDYREENYIPPGSTTETFVALKLYVDNWRWQEVPIYIRTGKRLAGQVSEIAIHFKEVPHQVFPGILKPGFQSSVLVFALLPDEGIVFHFLANRPGIKSLLQQVAMHFNYQESFDIPHPDAYESLLWDILKNDASLFMNSDQIEASWSVITPILLKWKERSSIKFPNYMAGSWGPDSAQTLVARSGHLWHTTTSLRDNLRQFYKIYNA